MMLVLTDAIFVITHKKYSLVRKTGFSISDLLPEGFELQTSTLHIAPPMDKAILQSSDFCKDFKSLFTKKQVQYTHSTFLVKWECQKRQKAKTNVIKLCVSFCQLKNEAIHVTHQS